MLKSVVYTSSANTAINEEVLKSILKESVRYNNSRQISGLLIYHDGTFLQVIEGDKKEVEGLFKRICKDVRHRNVTILFEEDIEEREFGAWAMAFKEVHDEDLCQLEDYVKLDDLHFGEVIKEGGAKSILKAFYEMNISSGAQHMF